MKNSAKGVPAVALKVLMAVGVAVLLCGSANAQGVGNAQGPANTQATRDAAEFVAGDG